MAELVRKLSFACNDVISKIIPYTYRTQSKVLLNDIENYQKSYKVVTKLYHKFWIEDWAGSDPPEKNQDLDWLINDMYGWANDDQALMLGYIPKFYEIWSRNFYSHHVQRRSYFCNCGICRKFKPNGTSYVSPSHRLNWMLTRIERMDSAKQIRVFWAQLKPEERNAFIISKISSFFTEHEWSWDGPEKDINEYLKSIWNNKKTHDITNSQYWSVKILNDLLS